MSRWRRRAACCCVPCAGVSAGSSRITCAITEQEACLGYLAAEADDPYELLVCTDFLESGNGFDLVREARQLHPKLHTVILALGDAIPAECSQAPWLEAVVAEADFVGDQQPLRAAVMAVLGVHYYRSPSLWTAGFTIDHGSGWSQSFQVRCSRVVGIPNRKAIACP